MQLNARSTFRVVLLVSAFVLAVSLRVVFQSPVSAQVSPQIPRIEKIEGNEPNVPPSYRLVISRAQNIVFVTCPSKYAPKLGYLRNVEAIQCERI